MMTMVIVASVNFIVDPGEIYLKKIIADLKSQEFSGKLFHSKNGVIQSGWNERLVKTALAKSAGDFDCIILGSSHIMQISIVRNTGNIKDNCSSLLNLGVSGGGIEDISIFSYLALNNLKLPRKVFIAIDPWTLKFGMDPRYGAYQSYLEKMNMRLDKNGADENTSYSRKIAQNLFNGEYFYYSILSLLDGNKKGNLGALLQKVIQYPEKNFSFLEGASEAVTLKDGSHVYAHSWIQKQRNASVGIGGGGYKIKDKVYDVVALEYFNKIIKLYQQSGVEVNLVMTPYHPNVFKMGKTKAVLHISIIEKVVKKFSQMNNIKYYGSLFPDELGCVGDEFFDFMHPTNECLGRINFSQ